MRNAFLVLLAALAFGACQAQDAGAETKPAYRTVTFPSGDGLPITGDLSAFHAKSAPVILLCHQARSSRGEYRPVTPRLVAAGFNVLAIDQRSGQGMNGVENATAARAAEAGKGMTYLDARQDIEAALKWLDSEGFTGRTVLWGSSYSSALALVIGGESAAKDRPDAVIAFAPGEYLAKTPIVGEAAAKLAVPTLIVSPESERGQAEPIAARIPKGLATTVIDGSIVHGSKTLFRGEGRATAWKAVQRFLTRHVKNNSRWLETKMGNIETITLGGGCFWCVEAVLERIDGILDVKSGYMGGHVDNPTYEQVCTKKTGHVEVVEATFDPDVITLEEVLEWFWRAHDPTTKDRQGADKGPQYRSAIFYNDERQKAIAEKSLAELDASGQYLRPAVTVILPAATFWPAENYHQDYFARNPNQGYCQYVIAPKVNKLFKKEKKSTEGN